MKLFMVKLSSVRSRIGWWLKWLFNFFSMGVNRNCMMVNVLSNRLVIVVFLLSDKLVILLSKVGISGINSLKFIVFRKMML